MTVDDFPTPRHTVTGANAFLTIALDNGHANATDLDSEGFYSNCQIDSESFVAHVSADSESLTSDINFFPDYPPADCILPYVDISITPSSVLAVNPALWKECPSDMALSPGGSSPQAIPADNRPIPSLTRSGFLDSTVSAEGLAVYPFYSPFPEEWAVMGTMQQTFLNENKPACLIKDWMSIPLQHGGGPTLPVSQLGSLRTPLQDPLLDTWLKATHTKGTTTRKSNMDCGRLR